jgi:hypothetical protein
MTMSGSMPPPVQTVQQQQHQHHRRSRPEDAAVHITVSWEAIDRKRRTRSRKPSRCEVSFFDDKIRSLLL